MKALVYDDVETLRYREMPMPVPGRDEHLVRIEAVGICGSDMHAYLGHDERRPAPLILGHEAAGIVEDGPRNKERVAINPLVTCGACPACLSGRDNLCGTRQIISMPPRQGAFSEWIAIPGRNLVSVPDHVPLEQACLAEPIACGWHGARIGQHLLREKFDNPRVLVIGGGAIGLGSALSLRARGVSETALVEENPKRRAYLEEVSDLKVLCVEDLATDDLFDLVIDGVGLSATRALASARTRPGGAIIHIGLGEDTGGLDIRRMTLQEITFVGTYTYTSSDFAETAQAIFDGRLGALDWFESRPLENGAQAFRDIRAGNSPCPKIVLIPRGPA
ncbi:zinc-dependent alcohol dehydrogenase [Aestuariibius insulae]|uniref:zinc-dependent alcohol dehydrogenase n=1 Tax=Aestuariibius insulae TaxID=2058287 RepID=UPI00345F0300